MAPQELCMNFLILQIIALSPGKREFTPSCYTLTLITYSSIIVWIYFFNIQIKAWPRGVPQKFFADILSVQKNGHLNDKFE